MPTLEKLLSKFNKRERKILGTLTTKIISLDWRNLSVKKLKGYQKVFLVRKGKLRIIFSKDEGRIIFFSIERRSNTTYKL